MSATIEPRGGDSADPDGPWECGWARCEDCGYVWMVVRPYSVAPGPLECGRCSAMNAFLLEDQEQHR